MAFLGGIRLIMRGMVMCQCFDETVDPSVRGYWVTEG